VVINPADYLYFNTTTVTDFNNQNFNFFLSILYSYPVKNFFFWKTNITLNIKTRGVSFRWVRNFRQVFGDGFFYLRGIFLICFVDACLTDDEPIWEPVE
jgi:hypothetical protein